MSLMIILGFAVLLNVVLVAFVLARRKRGCLTSEAWPFYAKKVLSAPEQVLYFRLEKALPEYFVLAQVQASRVLGVKKGNDFQAWNNRINRMSLDFVICARDALVVAVIELDDSTHEKAERKVADAKKDKALEAAGVRIFRWSVRSLPEVDYIASILGVEHRRLEAI